MSSIHEHLRSLRKGRGLTQRDLALQSGVSFSFINEVEQGKPTIRLDVLSKLASVFGYQLTLTKMPIEDAGQNAVNKNGGSA